MTIINDLATILGQDVYETSQGNPDTAATIDYVNGSISAFSDITNELTLPADFEDTNIVLTDGSTMSLYGFDSENTLVLLSEQEVEGSPLIWCHCFKYANSPDYEECKTLHTPDISLRV